MKITQKYNDNLNNYATNDVKTLVKALENFFYPSLYYSTDEGFHICAYKDTDKLPSNFFIAYGICGLFSSYPVTREYTLNRLYKKDSKKPFQYKKLFIPDQNRIDYIENDSQTFKVNKLHKGETFKGTSLFFTRCSHFNHTNKEDIDLTAKGFFNLLVRTAYRVYGCTDSSILEEIDNIGSIEIIPGEKAIMFFKEYFSSVEFLDMIPYEKIRNLFDECNKRFG